MILVVAADDRGGMLFGGRRVSQDRLLRKYLLGLAHKSGKRFWMNAYTYRLFLKDGGEGMECVVSDEAFLEKAGKGDFCCVENVPAAPFEEKAEEICYCRWNRRYPADTFFDIDLAGWLLASSEDLTGSSHEKITIERYIRPGAASGPQR